MGHLISRCHLLLWCVLGQYGFLVTWQMCWLLFTCTWRHNRRTDLLFGSSLCPISNPPCHGFSMCTPVISDPNLHRRWQYHSNFQHTPVSTSLQPHFHWCRHHLHGIQHPLKGTTHPWRSQLYCRCDFTQEVFTCPTVRTWHCHFIFPTPLTTAGGSAKMIPSPVHARQPPRQPWTREHLFWEWAIALGQAIDNSTWKNYGSALNSYRNFIKIHDFPLNPTAETLSLFTVYMCHHIKPNSVATYLSGICQQLEPYFLSICSARNSALVHSTLQGCKRLHAVPMSRKRALTLDDLETVTNSVSGSNDYDDHLFLAQLLTGFSTLFRLGEMTYPDDPKLRDPRKVTKCNSVQVCDSSFQFFLPGHEANRFFEGNIIIMHKNHHTFDPHKFFTAYLHLRDNKFPLSSPLWLTSKGTVLTRSFFIKCLRHFFNSDTAGQSLRAGSATSLAENGVAPSIIQAISRWASDTFKIYIQKNPVLIQALLFGQTACLHSSFIYTFDSWFFLLLLYRLCLIWSRTTTHQYSQRHGPTHPQYRLLYISRIFPSLLTSITTYDSDPRPYLMDQPKLTILHTIWSQQTRPSYQQTTHQWWLGRTGARLLNFSTPIQNDFCCAHQCFR